MSAGHREDQADPVAKIRDALDRPMEFEVRNYGAG
jgi:hypothetical protein